jgi:Domain of unknown function (DUF397)
MDLTRAVWRKSSYSGNNGGACIEVTEAVGAIAVRDSKDPSGPVLVITRQGWDHFAAGVRNGKPDAR